MTMLQRCLDRLKLDYKKEKRNNRRGQIATRRNTVSMLWKAKRLAVTNVEFIAVRSVKKVA